MKTQLFAVLVGFALSSVCAVAQQRPATDTTPTGQRRHAADASTCGGIRPADDPVG